MFTKHDLVLKLVNAASEPTASAKQEILLSILIPSVFERDCTELTTKLLSQIGDKPVEVLVFKDNRKRSTGLKRQTLLDMAQGRYVTCLDDDDSVSDDYIDQVCSVIESQLRCLPPYDVIVFNSKAQIIGHDSGGENPFVVRCGLEYENEQSSVQDGVRLDIKRKPWHWCVWEATVARKGTFPDGCIDDDWYWLRQIIPYAVTQHRIDKELHYYRYDASKSLSNTGKPACT